MFLYKAKEGGNTTTITSTTGHAERSDPLSPIVLKLQNGVQQLMPGGSADSDGSGEVVIRFREFETTFANPDDDFRPRGEDEREMTLFELWMARGNPPPHVDPWEIESELDGRLVRIATLPILPLMAIPLAIGRVRGQRSYGLVIGLAFLVAFYQVLQVGESLADNNKLPSWLALWVPFAVFGLISAWMFVRASTRVPNPRLGLWVDAQVDRLGRLLSRRRSAVAQRG